MLAEVNHMNCGYSQSKPSDQVTCLQAAQVHRGSPDSVHNRRHSADGLRSLESDLDSDAGMLPLLHRQSPQAITRADVCCMLAVRAIEDKSPAERQPKPRTTVQIQVTCSMYMSDESVNICTPIWCICRDVRPLLISELPICRQGATLAFTILTASELQSQAAAKKLDG